MHFSIYNTQLRSRNDQDYISIILRLVMPNIDLTVMNSSPTVSINFCKDLHEVNILSFSKKQRPQLLNKNFCWHIISSLCSLLWEKTYFISEIIWNGSALHAFKTIQLKNILWITNLLEPDSALMVVSLLAGRISCSLWSVAGFLPSQITVVIWGFCDINEANDQETGEATYWPVARAVWIFDISKKLA